MTRYRKGTDTQGLLVSTRFRKPALSPILAIAQAMAAVRFIDWGCRQADSSLGMYAKSCVGIPIAFGLRSASCAYRRVVEVEVAVHHGVDAEIRDRRRTAGSTM